MYGRKMKLDMPLPAVQSTVIDRNTVAHDQDKMRKIPGKMHNLEVGDTVLFKQTKRNKLTTAYDVKPAMVTVESDHSQITRDGSRFKQVDKRVAHPVTPGASLGREEEEESVSDGENEIIEEESDLDRDFEVDEGLHDVNPGGSHSQGNAGITEPQSRTATEPHHGSIARSREPRATAGKPPIRFGDYVM